MARAAGLLPLGWLLAGCSGIQSAIDPKGPVAERLAGLFWFFTVTCGTIWVLVMAAMLLAVWRRRPAGAAHPEAERRAGRAVLAAVVATAATLVLFTVTSFLGQAHEKGEGDALQLTVTGRQWWWEIRYDDAAPARTLVTANELHLPVGRPVVVKLRSTDVIHSFWAPNLAGKLDLIPGRENVLRFTAAKAGTFRGQCAEFCGLQHARMAFLVVVESEADFRAWRERQLAAAAPPATEAAARGREVFLGGPCATCHTVRGTAAAGRLGPDLTHVASRRTIAAGVMETTRGSLAAWVADPQRIKPGAQMPRVSLSGDELDALAAYLASLE